jgi:AbrB family looped-hinge helix DNA binding protein
LDISGIGFLHKYTHGRIAAKPQSRKAATMAAMKAALTISSRGTLTLPAKLRQSLGLKADDQLIAETAPGGLLLRPAVTLPVEMYTKQRIAEFDAAEAELASALARKKRRAR